VPSWQAHPLRELLERGVRVTLNTDDPSISGIDLAHEYRVASEKLGLTEDQLRAMQETALEAAFLSDEERQTLRSAPSTEP
jgi:adenosine deaminase